MSDFVCNGPFERQKRLGKPAKKRTSADEDLLMEQILENLNTTPIGQVLKKIASLPEVRKEKILNIRQELTEGRYDINKRLNIALDKVLEEFTK